MTALRNMMLIPVRAASREAGQRRKREAEQVIMGPQKYISACGLNKSITICLHQGYHVCTL